MDNRQIISVSNNNMLSVFVGVDLVHPYRFQPNFRFDIDFREYKRFVMSMSLKGLNVLHQTPARYRSALDKEDDVLFRRLFYWDMSVAVMAEISLAESLDAQASMISHSFGGTTETFLFENAGDFVTEKFDDDTVTKAIQSLSRATNHSTTLNLKNICRHNKAIYYYAIALRCLSIYGDSIKIDAKF